MSLHLEKIIPILNLSPHLLIPKHLLYIFFNSLDLLLRDDVAEIMLCAQQSSVYFSLPWVHSKSHIPVSLSCVVADSGLWLIKCERKKHLKIPDQEHEKPCREFWSVLFPIVDCAAASH